jgi:hypothetical protein
LIPFAFGSDLYGWVIRWSDLVALPNDRSSEKIEGRELADIAERIDPVPAAVIEAARDAFRSRRIPDAQPVPIDRAAARVVEAATNNDRS